MSAFDRFREALRGALVHLYDPSYQPTEMLCAVIGCDARNGAGPVQSEIIQAIKILQPPPDTPATSRARQDYDLLNHRYILQLTQEETAGRLHTSVRKIRRDQREATHTLARLLWEHSLARDIKAQESGQEQEAIDQGGSWGSNAADWRAQVRQDLASLETSSTAKVASVREIANSAIELESALLARHGMSVRVGEVPADLAAEIHPSVLRQVLIMAIAQLGRGTAPGEIRIHARLEDGFVLLILTAPAGDVDRLPDGGPIREVLAFGGGALAVTSDDSQVSFCIRVPAAGRVSVLVVDDNADSVHYYRRCTAGTRFHILHAPQGMAAVEAIAAARPDVIVLDIVLPDIDGWELLRRLQSDPEVRAIPVIVCSIVPEKDLALALGATFYLPKPIRHRDFLQTLDRAINPAATAAPRL